MFYDYTSNPCELIVYRLFIYWSIKNLAKFEFNLLGKVFKQCSFDILIIQIKTKTT